MQPAKRGLSLTKHDPHVFNLSTMHPYSAMLGDQISGYYHIHNHVTGCQSTCNSEDYKTPSCNLYAWSHLHLVHFI